MSIELMIVIILVIAGVSYVAYKVIIEVRESREPLYLKFQKTHFQSSQNSTTEYCPICRRPSAARHEWNKRTILCGSCDKLVCDRSILRRLDVPDVVARNCQVDQLIALNLIQIDLQRGNISEGEAAQFSKNVVRDIVESRSKYKKIKAKLQSLKRSRVEPWMLEEASGDSVTCRVCNRSRYGDCECLNDFHVDYGQGKIPSTLRAISREAQRLSRPEMGFWFEDWLYLKLIADDLGQGIIDKDEAERECKNYIDGVYNDAKQKLEAYKASCVGMTEDARCSATATSQSFMDDMLS